MIVERCKNNKGDNKMKLLVAKRNGACKYCDKEIIKGEIICFEPKCGSWHIEHNKYYAKLQNEKKIGVGVVIKK